MQELRARLLRKDTAVSCEQVQTGETVCECECGCVKSYQRVVPCLCKHACHLAVQGILPAALVACVVRVALGAMRRTPRTRRAARFVVRGLRAVRRLRLPLSRCNQCLVVRKDVSGVVVGWGLRLLLVTRVSPAAGRAVAALAGTAWLVGDDVGHARCILEPAGVLALGRSEAACRPCARRPGAAATCAGTVRAGLGPVVWRCRLKRVGADRVECRVELLAREGGALRGLRRGGAGGWCLAHVQGRSLWTS